MSDAQANLRKDVLELLRGGGAHLHFDKATANLPPKQRGAKPDGQPHTVWRLVEHMRRAQHDILEFIVDPDYESPDWPDGYWPDGDGPAPSDADEAWEQCLADFHADAKRMQTLVADPKTDLLQPISHGSGHTVLREAMLVADHNAYHLGQVVMVRRLLGAWEDEG